MEESLFEPGILTISDRKSSLWSSEVDSDDVGPRQAAFAILMCLFLVVMFGVVVIFVITDSGIGGADLDIAVTKIRKGKGVPPAGRRPEIVPTSATIIITDSSPTTTTTTTAPPLREIICTMGNSGKSAAMYPPDKYCDYLFYSDVVLTGRTIASPKKHSSLIPFLTKTSKYKTTQLGFSFDFQKTEPYDLDEAEFILKLYRNRGIKHYGLLTVIAFPSNFSAAVMSTKPILKKFKQVQGNHTGAKTVIAIGSYDYSGSFMDIFKRTFTEVVNTYDADMVIAITSTGWIGYSGFCNAVPPTALISNFSRYPSLFSHWFVVTPGNSYTKPSTQVGLSFELSALQYVLVNNASSLKESLFLPCESVKKTSRDALCGQGGFGTHAAEYLGNDAYAYGVLSNASKVVTMSEYNDSLALKFTTGGQNFGGVRARTAWLIYNIQDQDFNSECPDPPYNVIRLFCMALKGTDHPRCR